MLKMYDDTSQRYKSQTWQIAEIDSYQNERGCYLCLELSHVHYLLLWHLESLAVSLVEEPGVDHSKGDGVPEDVHVPTPGFQVELVFRCERVQQIHASHVFVVGTHNVRPFNVNVGFVGFVPALNLFHRFWSSEGGQLHHL